MGEQIKHLPEMLEKPIAVLASKEKGRVVVVTQYFDKNGDQIIVPVIIGTDTSSDGGLRITANIAASTFGKQNVLDLINDAIEKEKNGGVAIFGANKKIASKLPMAGTPIVPTGGFNAIHNIDDVNSPVKGLFKKITDSLQFKKWFGDSEVVNGNGEPLVVYRFDEKKASRYNAYSKKIGVIPADVVHNIAQAGINVKPQTETLQFKKWFGDSMVVNGNGEPLVVYRRDDENFTVFDINKTQKTDAGFLGKGFYFYGDKTEAEGPAKGYGENLRAFYLKAENPYFISQEEVNDLVNANDKTKSAEFVERLKEEGYDSVYWNGDLRQEWMVFEPTQIKSATDNIGTFDAKNPDIRYSLRKPGMRDDAGKRNESINGMMLDKISGNLGKYFSNVKDAIRALYAKALLNKSEGNKSFVNFAPVTEEERSTLSMLSGSDLSGAKVHGIDESAIKHADNRHGFSEKRTDQTPVSEDDFVRIPEIIKGTKPEYQGKNAVGNHVFQYRKQIGNEYFYLEEYRNGQGKLSGVSLWKKKKGTTEAQTSKDNLDGMPTPEALFTRASDDIISQNPEMSTGEDGKIGGKHGTDGTYETDGTLKSDLSDDSDLSDKGGVQYSLRSSGMRDIERINTVFNDEIDRQISGEMGPGCVYQLGRPSPILLNTGIPNLPIELSSSRLSEKANNERHPFDLKDVKDLPLMLQDPIGIFAYGDKNKAQNILIEVQKNGKNFIVGLRLNYDRNGLMINSIRGLFPKDTHEWLTWIQNGKSLYLDKEKIQKLINQQRMNFADVEYLDLDLVDNIIQNFKNTTGEERDFEENDGSRFQYSLRKKAEPEKKLTGYKVFALKKNRPGELFPPMVANPGGASTPAGVWLDADAAPRASDSKTGRMQVQAGGEGTNTGKQTLAYRPGWHLGPVPDAKQFLVKNPETEESL